MRNILPATIAFLELDDGGKKGVSKRVLERKDKLRLRGCCLAGAMELAAMDDGLCFPKHSQLRTTSRHGSGRARS